MVFSSLQFLLIFVPVFFCCYYLTPDKFKNFILMLGSLVFYFVGTIDNPEYFILFLLSIMADFAIGAGMEKYPGWKKCFLVSGVIFHLAVLGIFKYLGFVLGEAGKILPGFDFMTELVLPLGISFYTFQGISYLTDVYRGTVKAEKRLMNYAVYISMFSKLMAGPITAYGKVEKELRRKKITLYSVLNGAGIFIFGLGFKVLLANPLGKLWNQTCAIGFESISTPLAWIAAVAFSFQIYFDFFGYSLMAVGLGKMTGFNLPKNFDHPYMSLTMTEFWRRWHITLGAWFREYVYIPLGGNRKGKFATIRNLFIVWLLTGIWHGAGYHFILWGLVLFVLVVLEKMLTGRFLNRNPVWGHIYMAFVIPLSWMIFAIDDLGQLGVFFTRLFPLFGQGVWSGFRYDYLKYLQLYYPFLLAGLVFSCKKPFVLLKKIKNRVVIVLLLAVILCASIYCMYQGMDDPFMYFRF